MVAGRASVLTCYSFGKAQRILGGVDPSIGPIIVHGAVEPLNRAYRAAGVELPATRMVVDVKDKADLRRALVICPPSAAASPWMRRFGDAQTAFASGWMQLRGARRRGGYDRGFVQRIGRKALTRKVLADAPVTFMAYDLLEQDCQDIRALPQRERRARLEALLEGTAFKLSPIETHPSWLEFAARAVARIRRRGVHAQAP